MPYPTTTSLVKSVPRQISRSDPCISSVASAIMITTSLPQCLVDLTIRSGRLLSEARCFESMGFRAARGETGKKGRPKNKRLADKLYLGSDHEKSAAHTSR